MKGADLNTVRELLGHKSVKMTLRYARLSPTHRKKAIERIDAAFSTPQGIQKLTHARLSEEGRLHGSYYFVFSRISNARSKLARASP